MLTSRPSTLNVTKTVSPLTQAKQIEDTRRKEVQLILENLFEREEDTVKLVIDCLFDMGAVYFINRKIPTPIVNPLAKRVATLSKSGIRILAFRYVMKQFVLSGFLTNFLFNKVKGLIGANQPPKKNKKPAQKNKKLASKAPSKGVNPQKSLQDGQETSNLPKKEPSLTPQDQNPPQDENKAIATYNHLTPESQQALNHHIQCIAKVIYEETHAQPLSLAQVETIIRQQTIQSLIQNQSASSVQTKENPQSNDIKADL